MTDPVLVAIIMSAPGSIAAITAAAIGWHNRGSLKAVKNEVGKVKDELCEVKTEIDGHMEKLLATTRALGLVDGAASEKEKNAHP